MGNLAPLVPQKTSPYGHLAKLVPQKHRRDGMSRLGTSRNVQWSAEGAKNVYIPDSKT